MRAPELGEDVSIPGQAREENETIRHSLMMGRGFEPAVKVLQSRGKDLQVKRVPARRGSVRRRQSRICLRPRHSPAVLGSFMNTSSPSPGHGRVQRQVCGRPAAGDPLTMPVPNRSCNPSRKLRRPSEQSPKQQWTHRIQLFLTCLRHLPESRLYPSGKGPLCRKYPDPADVSLLLPPGSVSYWAVSIKARWRCPGLATRRNES